MGANWKELVRTLREFVCFGATPARTEDRSNVLGISPSKLPVYGFNGGARKTAAPAPAHAHFLHFLRLGS